MCAYYYGGKSRTGKDIAIAIKNHMKDIKCYELIEPFCGMLGVSKNLINDYLITCSDYNEDLIFLHKYIQENPNFTMPVISKERFNELKVSNELSFERSFAMFCCTYLAMYKGSYVSNDSLLKSGKIRHIHSENFKSIKNIIVPISNKIDFYCKEYNEWESHLSQGSFIIYCDPPYVDTFQKYKTKIFDTDKFWKTVKRWKDYGNYVFVSELTCPIEHEVIYSKTLACSTSTKKKQMLDKLFFIL